MNDNTIIYGFVGIVCALICQAILLYILFTKDWTLQVFDRAVERLVEKCKKKNRRRGARYTHLLQ